MHKIFPTKFVQKLTGVTVNQLKYWVRINLVSPERIGKASFYSFKDIVKLRILVSLRRAGLSLQKMREGVRNLSRMLPDNEPLTRLIIYTDGADMIVIEKGMYFSAITKQQYFRFDTEQIGAEIIRLQNFDAAYESRTGPLKAREKVMSIPPWVVTKETNRRRQSRWAY